MNCAKKMILAVAILNASLASTVVMASDSTTSLISAAAAMQSNEDMPSLAPLLDKVIPAVVNISVQGKKSLNNDMANNIPEQFRFFFPDMPKEREFQALGSGVVINVEKGYIITNYHVVDGASEIKITFQDGRVIKATKVGEDEQTDFALLKLETIPKNLTALKFADSDKLRVGDFAIAIGNPFGLGQTVTSGIISALGRSGLNIENYENFIQTDAAINSGNSGGALINLRGELIGINTAILGKSGGNIGIGFAIPSNMANNIAQQIMKHGSVKRGMLGIMGTEVTDELAKNFEYENTNGAFVNEVMKGSAAEKAGLITSVSFNYGLSDPMTVAPSTIYMGEVDRTAFYDDEDRVPLDSLTQMFSGSVSFSQGWVTITFDEPFIYSGTGNLVVGYLNNSGQYLSELEGYFYVSNTADYKTNVYFSNWGI